MSHHSPDLPPVADFSTAHAFGDPDDLNASQRRNFGRPTVTAQAGVWARIRRLARKWRARHVVGPWPTDHVERHVYSAVHLMGCDKEANHE